MAIVVKLLAKSTDEQWLQYIKIVALNEGSGKAADVVSSFLDNNDIAFSEEENAIGGDDHADEVE